MAEIIDGKALRNRILEGLKAEVKNLDKKPFLAVIIVGNDPASKIYVSNKKKTALELGFQSVVIEMPENTPEKVLLEKIEELNKNKEVNAILVQLPLPAHISTERVIETVSPQKDVDCFHPFNTGKIAQNARPFVYPCTPKGIIRLLEEYKIPVAGKNAVVIGRSNIVGRPVAAMLTNLDATVTICHSKTQNLSEITKNADILISAAGSRGLVTADMVKDGAAVFDVGMNRDENGKLAGDVDFEAVKEKASFITPVPGGVGPMTICTLMTNTFELFRRQNK
ncbi:TPA: bifunctional 5,10-methylene-tetrahydrofolate dehydrogenase/5,10-methylene-tetrahydrofolate cyclohydrolase [Candidatus Spyradomonas excrementavium]|nr:bifunctional 5,10-methylene-tetrahydrofolate dehydrogenase/5,10-methylene-tetrahydrofolate cyclohydrolase [Candidatus Spyradomonas excrementavium]